jgi:hypothetical protein
VPITTAANFNAVAASLPVNSTTGTEIYFTSGLTSLLAGNINQTTQSHLFQYNDNLTWIKGQHTVKFGGDIRALQSISTLGDNGLNTAEVFPFCGLYTSAYFGGLLGTSFNGVAYQFADYLAGAPVETQYYSLVPKDGGAAAYYAFFGQDQWRIAPRLNHSRFSLAVRNKGLRIRGVIRLWLTEVAICSRMQPMNCVRALIKSKLSELQIARLKIGSFACGFFLSAFGSSSSEKEILQTGDQPVTIPARDLALLSQEPEKVLYPVTSPAMV